MSIFTERPQQSKMMLNNPRYRFCIPAVILHGVISLPDATSYENSIYPSIKGAYSFTLYNVCTGLGIYEKEISWRSFVTVLHTCVSIMLKCIKMQNLIKLYHAANEL